ncbi:MAG: hypothetical protein GF311_22665 [Candidatus Lokiarchaeota archaeon]|jgi:rRNA processing protein Gar1|nr:hypothetical protein [Candidatus Lokiarchaeota archaeon]
MNWHKLNLFHLGFSAKNHAIFRATKWNKKLEAIIKKPIFNEEYEKIGFILDIFGPHSNPFISIKPEPNIEIGKNNKFYVKVA